MELDKFKENCLKRICLRRTLINDKCKTLSKQENCHTKYMKKQESGGYMYQRPNKGIRPKLSKPIKRTPIKKKFKKDARYEDFQNAVWQREAKINMPPKGQVHNWKNYCQFWKCLNLEEQKQFIQFVQGKEWMLNTIEVAHIKGKGAFAELKYEPENAVLCNHFSHSLLDIHKNPLTGKDITDEERTSWFKRMKETKKEIEEHLLKL